MRRYRFLNRDDVYLALNRLRDAFLAALDGSEVEKIINGILTHDERLKIGRRILIAEYIKDGARFQDIMKDLKVGKNTITEVTKCLENYPECFAIIDKRRQKVDAAYANKKYRPVGGSKLIFKKKEHTGFKRKDVKRY